MVADLPQAIILSRAVGGNQETTELIVKSPKVYNGRASPIRGHRTEFVDPQPGSGQVQICHVKQ